MIGWLSASLGNASLWTQNTPHVWNSFQNKGYELNTLWCFSSSCLLQLCFLLLLALAQLSLWQLRVPSSQHGLLFLKVSFSLVHKPSVSLVWCQKEPAWVTERLGIKVPLMLFSVSAMLLRRTLILARWTWELVLTVMIMASLSFWVQFARYERMFGVVLPKNPPKSYIHDEYFNGKL